MSKLNTLFRKRVDIQENKQLTFDMLPIILEKTATTIPFENLCLFSKNMSEISEQNLINKILVRNEGGLCYELNTLLYYFLAKNDFTVRLVQGITYDQVRQDFSAVGRTHIIILLAHNDQTYVVDTGFGGNLPLRPIPMSGEVVTSSNGDFRIKKVINDYGDHFLEMKLRHKDTEWKIGYAFHYQNQIRDVSDINEVQRTIHENPKSPFTKNRLITRLTVSGSITLTDTSITHWVDGIVMKEDIDIKDFKTLAKKHFDIES